MSDSERDRARLVGINHVAIEVGDLDAALDIYESVFEFDFRGRSDASAFLDMGDQFLAVAEVDDPADGGHRHVGVVVDDLDAVERRLGELDVEGIDLDPPDFRDPWGNWFQVVAYDEVQFTKADHVLRGMGLAGLGKSESALAELEEKGLAPD